MGYHGDCMYEVPLAYGPRSSQTGSHYENTPIQIY